MSATEAYMAALDAGDDRALGAAEEKLKREQGGVVLVRCLEEWLARANGASSEAGAVKRRLADVLEEVAKSRTADDAAGAAAKAAGLRAELSDEAGADRAAALALSLAVADDGALDRHVTTLGGRPAACARVSRRLKDKELKKDAAATAALRRVLARLAELDGDKERAFLESLRAVRKAPEEPLYVDEVFRLCLAADKSQELTAVLCELGEQEDLSARHRATLWNKVGHLREREQGDEAGALEAYRRSVTLYPESKGAQRHAARLARALGVIDDEDEQEIDDADVVASEPSAAPMEAADVEVAGAAAAGAVPSSDHAEVTGKRAPPPLASDEEPSVFSKDGVAISVNEGAASAAVAAGDVVAEGGDVESMARSLMEPLPALADAALDNDEPMPSSLPVPAPEPPPQAVHEPLATDDEVPVTAPRSREGAATTLGSQEETKQEISEPSFDGPVSSSSLLPATKEAGPLLAVPTDLDEEGLAASASLYSTPTPAPFTDESAEGGGERHGLVADEEEEDPATEKSHPGRDVSTVLELPHAKDTLVEASEPGASSLDSSQEVAPRSSLSASISSSSLPSSSFADEPRANAKGKRRKDKRKKRKDKRATLSGEPAAKAPVPATTEPAGAPAFSDVSDAGSGAPSLYAEAPLPADDDAAPLAARAVAADDDVAPAPALVPQEPVAATAATTTPAVLELPPDTAAEEGGPSHQLDRTEREAGGRDVFAEADSLLEGDDAGACLEIARELLEHPSKGSLVIRLAARALEVVSLRTSEDEDNAGWEEAIDLFVEEAPSNASLAVSLGQSLWEAMAEDARARALPVWVAAARAAGDDVKRAQAFLEPFAAKDAPHGMAFRQLDQALASQRDVDGRSALWAKAFAATAAADEQRRRAVLVGHIRLLSDAGRSDDVLALYETLVVEVAPGDEVLRERAVAAFDAHAGKDVKERFLERLAKSVKGPQAIVILRRLLQGRRAAGESAGAESAARALLERNPGDAEAVDALCELLAPHAHRGQERAELLRLRFDLAKKKRDKKALPRAARDLAAQLTSLALRADALDVLRTALLEVPDDHGLFSDVSERLVGDGRDADLVKLVEDLVDKTREPARKVELLLKGAEVSRVRLKKLSRAQELVERALEISGDNVSALLARADIAQDLGDAAGALAPLERLAARLDDVAERARVHYRIGRLLEEHLLRPDDARRRYRAAVEGSPARRDAWEALLALAEKSNNRDDQVEALTGIARIADGDERAALFMRIARLERDERVDVEAAERALRKVLEAAPAHGEAFEELLLLVVARLTGEHDVEAVLQNPPEPVLQELERVLEGVMHGARKQGRSLSPRVRRLYALSLGRQGEVEQAKTELDALLKAAPTDLPTLVTYARLLEDSARSDEDASGRRKKLLETALLHHAPDLDDEQQVRLWGDVGALRWFADERESARNALRQAVIFAVDKGQQKALSDGALEAAVSALRSEQGKERDPRAIISALRMIASRWRGPEGLEFLLDAARIAREEQQDAALTRVVLEEAIALDPDARAPKKALLDLDVLEGNAGSALKTTRELLERERDDKKKAALHVQLAELHKGAGEHAAASKELKRALKLDPQSRAVLDAAEAFFGERKDAEGLAALYSAQLKGMSKDDVSGRVALLERLAQVRRYDLRDLPGAVEALEAITALDPEATKPREDAARIYTELGQWREATSSWRGVLERDPLAVEGWRSLFSLYARTKQADEAFSVAASMVAVEIASDDMARSVRAVRPPFPRWPRAPKDPARLKRRLGHPLEATPIRMVLDVVGLRAHRLFARPLQEFGLSKRERLAERQVPPSVMLAIRTAREIVGLHDMPPLYRASGAGGTAPPAFALLPSPEPGLVVADEALTGGMTPERAFALGRAMAWLMPHAILAATLPPAQLKNVLESLVVRFIPGADVEGDLARLEHLGHQIEAEVFRGLPGPAGETLRRNLLASLRDYVHARDQVHLADWMAGVNYTADRLGFLLAGDLTPSVRVIRAAARQGQQLGARLAIKELVLFSVSAPYFTLRRELGLALPDSAARPVLDLL